MNDLVLNQKFQFEIPENVTIDQRVLDILLDKDKLLERKPFTRGATVKTNSKKAQKINPGQLVRAEPSRIRKHVISQDQYIEELDPEMHSVLFDENIPSICVKLENGGVQDIKFVKTALPFQETIKDKQTLHLACLPLKFTLTDKKPTDKQQADFIVFKQAWDERNQDGMKYKMVDCAKSYGDAGLLFYMDRKGEIRSRLISYNDGYVICSHNDQNGDRLLESVYYIDDNDNEVIDSWDDKNFYRIEIGEDDTVKLTIEEHGFSEIPLVTKRSRVAWEGGQTLIESYETQYNIFQVLQKRWGWGILYVKGKIDTKAQKLAGNIVLNDRSLDGNGDAKFLNPPSPSNSIDTLKQIFQSIEISTGTTFILPEDIHTSSDTSGIAVQMTQELDIQTAEEGVVEWRNAANKMARLFKEGLAMERVRKGLQPTAITDYQNLHVTAEFQVWKPFSESEFNQMLCTMKNSGVLSRATATEQNTISRPDELERITKEEQEKVDAELDLQKRKAELTQQTQQQTQSDPDGPSE